MKKFIFILIVLIVSLSTVVSQGSKQSTKASGCIEWHKLPTSTKVEMTVKRQEWKLCK